MQMKDAADSDELVRLVRADPCVYRLSESTEQT